MGYHVYITKAETSQETEEHPIGRDEWLRLVENDPSLTLCKGSDQPVGGGRASSPLVEWNDSGAYLDYFAGAIVAKYPNEATLGKMRRIAFALGARVLGEDDVDYTMPPPGRLVRQGPAVMAKAQGRLTLHETRFSFRPATPTFACPVRTWAIDAVASVTPVHTLRVIPRGVAIGLKDGSTLTIDVEGQSDWIRAFEAARREWDSAALEPSSWADPE
jgi:hypothetical protein